VSDPLKQIAALRNHVNDTIEAIEALWKEVVCSCCGGKDDVAIRRLMCKEPVCRHCVYIWYDRGITNPERLRELSLERQSGAQP
jgi:hypothetical protein